MTHPKFIADADLNEHLIFGLRRNEARVDFLNATDGRTRGIPDRRILEMAADAGRVIVSHDRNTMAEEFYRFLKEGRSSPGLIIVEQEFDEAEAIEELLLIWTVGDPEDLRDVIIWVPM